MILGREVSGQYRVTVPDPDALDRLRTQNRVYDRTLMPRDRFTGSVPVGVCSLPGSSRESSTEPMDTDEGAKTTRKIMESVRVARGWVHSDSEGYPLDTNSPLLTARSRREGPGSRTSRGEMSRGDPGRRQDATESPTLLQIPLCVTAGLKRIALTGIYVEPSSDGGPRRNQAGEGRTCMMLPVSSLL